MLHDNDKPGPNAFEARVWDAGGCGCERLSSNVRFHVLGTRRAAAFSCVGELLLSVYPAPRLSGSATTVRMSVSERRCRV